jgi:hypothetical protein
LLSSDEIKSGAVKITVLFASTICEPHSDTDQFGLEYILNPPIKLTIVMVHFNLK